LLDGGGDGDDVRPARRIRCREVGVVEALENRASSVRSTGMLIPEA
jgi:hypothetical protein